MPRPQRSITTRCWPEIMHVLFAACILRHIPDGYREELEANAKMFVERVKEEHHGIREVRIMNCVNDTIHIEKTDKSVHASEAFLVFCFGDSLNEEVVVPMVFHKNRWLMR